MRYDEVEYGVPLKDKNGKVYGKSIMAAKEVYLSLLFARTIAASQTLFCYHWFAAGAGTVLCSSTHLEYTNFCFWSHLRETVQFNKVCSG